MKQTLWQREKAKPISKSVLKHGKHPSVTAIRKLNIRSIFEFAFASLTRFLKEIKKLNPRRVAQSTDVPVKIERMLIYFNANCICRFLNESLNCCEFPTILKRASVTPIFEKGFHGSKEN